MKKLSDGTGTGIGTSKDAIAPHVGFSLQQLQSILKSRRFIEYILSVAVLLIAGAVIVLAQWRLPGDGFIVGEESPQTYRTRYPMTDEDPAETKQLREITEASIVDVAVRTSVNQERVNLRRSLDELFQTLWADMDISTSSPTSAARDTGVKNGLKEALLRMTEERRGQILEWTVQVGDMCIDELATIESDIERGANDRKIITEAEKATILWDIIGKNVPPSDANIVYQILQEYTDIRSKRSDSALTKRIRQIMVSDIRNITQRFEKGDVLVEKGQIITPDIARRLRYQGYFEEKFPIVEIMLVLLVAFTVPLCLDIPGTEPLKRQPSWLCILFTILITWCCEFIASLSYFDQSGAGFLTGVLIAYLSMSGTAAFSVSIAATVSSVLVLTLELPASDILLLLGMAVLTSTAGYYLLQRLSTRSQVRQRVVLMIILLYLLRATLLWIQGFSITKESLSFFNPVGKFWISFGEFVLLNSVMCTIATFLLTFVENYIGVITLFTLRDLSSTLTPLLQLMQKNAPGTYQHCLTMATLAESVAIAVGMDPNLMRVGAYYHDIGKLRRPSFFVENQGGGFNVHDDMTPTLSAITITSHVRDGLELAREYGLPHRVRDFILEHHGTTCVRYFYNKAVASGEAVTWEDFCYPGPKPQSRETALLMIVDSLEAAVRSIGLDYELMHQKKRAADGSIPHPNDGRGKIVEALKGRIKQVINSKINEGQFDDVDFTLQDIDRIAEALKDAILSMYHTREVKKIERRPRR